MKRDPQRVARGSESLNILWAWLWAWLWPWLCAIALTMTGCGKSSGQPEPHILNGTTHTADFLIYNGRGIDPSDTEAVATIVTTHGHTYRTITETELDAMSEKDFAQYGTLIWPGGDNEEIETALTPRARLNVRKAVVFNGLNYVGICAGAFVALGPEVPTAEPPAFGIALVKGNYLENYTAPDGNRDTMVWTLFPDGSKRELMLLTGPYFEVSKGIIAKYSDGKPAIIQTQVNKSLVILTGPHPEAPVDWQKHYNLTDTDGPDWDIAWKLIKAAHTQRPLPTFPDGSENDA